MEHPASPYPKPWQLLVLDRSDPEDPCWLLATIALDSDVRPAYLDDTGEPVDFLDVIAWAGQRAGGSVILDKIHCPLAWEIRQLRGIDGVPPTAEPGEAKRQLGHSGPRI